MKKLIAAVAVSILMACNGGYSFTGADVGEAETVSIDFFDNNADLINPQLSQIFTETLRDNFVQQTPLELRSSGGDLQFEGSITEYTITPINAQSTQGDLLGSGSAQNRLTVSVQVNFTHSLTPDKSFDQRFSRFADFDSNADLSQVEDELVRQISQELAENILNTAIGNW